jgi:hypothetical protein
MIRSRTFTRVIALIAAYAIALHGFLIAFAGFPVAAGTAGDANTSIELCLHSLVGGASLPEEPGPPSGDVHCKFCVGQAHVMAPAPTSCGAQFNFKTPGKKIWFVLSQDSLGSPRYLRKQPRGPPAAA